MLAVFVGCCTLVTVFALWNSYRFAEKQREKIYVGFHGGKSHSCLPFRRIFHRTVRLKPGEHVTRFHAALFRTVATDKDAIQAQYQLCLAAGGQKRLSLTMRDFAEKGYYNRLISGNINQVVRVDSVVCDFGHPDRARRYARQMIIRESNVTERSLVTDCQLQNTSRSDDNPNGSYHRTSDHTGKQGHKECRAMKRNMIRDRLICNSGGSVTDLP